MGKYGGKDLGERERKKVRVWEGDMDRKDERETSAKN